MQVSSGMVLGRRHETRKGDTTMQRRSMIEMAAGLWDGMQALSDGMMGLAYLSSVEDRKRAASYARSAMEMLLHNDYGRFAEYTTRFEDFVKEAETTEAIESL